MRRFGCTALAIGALFAAACDVAPSAPTFKEVNEQVLTTKCTLACHSGGMYAAGGLDMKSDPYDVLVHGVPPADSPCGGVTMKRIDPGHPETSLVYVKIEAKIHGTTPLCGDVMPLGDNTDPLSASEAEMIRAWIAAGAKND